MNPTYLWESECYYKSQSSLIVNILFDFTVTKGRHEIVPKDIREEAEKYAKVSNSISTVVNTPMD